MLTRIAFGAGLPPWDRVADTQFAYGVPLAGLTSFKIGGPAQVMARPQTPEAVVAVCHMAQQQGMSVTVLGGGSNVLVSDAGVSGVVLDLRSGFAYTQEVSCHPEGRIWEVGAAYGTGCWVRHAASVGLQGPEVLAGVPGRVGGALVMNAGGSTGEIQKMVHRIKLVHQGEMVWWGADQAGFAYRLSAFPKDAVLLAGEFWLRPADAGALQKQVKQAQRKRRATQPLGYANAGSIFKNPPGHAAGRLIEASGCKGWHEGPAQVSRVHANFIVNRAHAKAIDVVRLMRRVHRRVLKHTGVCLEPEVKFLGDVPAEGAWGALWEPGAWGDL